MLSQMQEFVAGRALALNDQVTRVRRASVKSARFAAQGSAESIKALKTPVRLVARSGIRLSNVSQTAVQELIELHSDALTAVLAEVARRLERAARATTVVELVRDQVEMLPATRARMASDAGRVAQIVTSAGREIRNVATETYGQVIDTAERPAQTRPRRPRKSAKARTAAKPRKVAGRRGAVRPRKSAA